MNTEIYDKINIKTNLQIQDSKMNHRKIISLVTEPPTPRSNI